MWAFGGASEAVTDEELGSTPSPGGRSSGKGGQRYSKKAVLLYGGTAALIILVVVTTLAATAKHHRAQVQRDAGTAKSADPTISLAPPPDTSAAPAAAPTTEEAAPTTAAPMEGTTASATAAKPSSCYDLYSKMTVNALQSYPENPDSRAYAFATCALCTAGNMTCTATVYGGKSQIIAAHIHLATSDDEGKEADGTSMEGPPVINFCGKNTPGLILDGTPYQQECPAWDANGAAHMADMLGSLVMATNKGFTQESRVADIVQYPHRYYFNFHTLASWTHWSQTGAPHGICRGQLELVGKQG